MTSPVRRPGVLLLTQGAHPMQLHDTVLAALATQSEAFAALKLRGRTLRRRLQCDIDAILESDDEAEDTPTAWRFVQTSEGYLGEAYFAIDQRAKVAELHQDETWVTDDGFEMTRPNGNCISIMAVETTGARTSVILQDGCESEPLTGNQQTLARDLVDSHSYATAVQASFALAVQKPLYKLRATLIQAQGQSVLLN